jgi:hypothetical protein
VTEDATGEVDRALDELYGLGPDEFVAARNALAGRLRDAGERAVADEVKGLRKPSVAAWAVNRLVRAHKEEVSRLVDVSRELREVHARSAGGDPEGLRRLTRRRHELVRGLTEWAARLFADAGVTASPAHLQRVSNTLLALTADRQGEDRLLEGRLTREEVPSGLIAGFTPAPAAEEAARQRADSRRRAEVLRSEAAAAERDAQRLETEAREAEVQARRARAAAGAARARAAAARRAADEANSSPR